MSSWLLVAFWSTCYLFPPPFWGRKFLHIDPLHLDQLHCFKLLIHRLVQPNSHGFLTCLLWSHIFCWGLIGLMPYNYVIYEKKTQHKVEIIQYLDIKYSIHVSFQNLQNGLKLSQILNGCQFWILLVVVLPPFWRLPGVNPLGVSVIPFLRHRNLLRLMEEIPNNHRFWMCLKPSK